MKMSKVNRDACLVESDKPTLKKILEKGPILGVRHLQTLLYFLLMSYTYCMRSVLSVAIVAMNDNSTTTNTDVPVFNWDDRSIVLSAFFWGYMVFQLPAAYLGKKHGAKWLLVGSTTLDSVSCIMIPTVAVHFGSAGVMVCRFTQGLAQGFVLPLIHTLLGSWAPPGERSRIGTFAYAGSVFGNIVAMPVTGVICSSKLGWPVSFYLWGAFGLKWVLLWIYFGADRPRCYQGISFEEKFYIESSLGQETIQYHRTPWKKILTSLPFWALISANIGVNFGSSVLLTQTPTYLDKILNYEIKSNSLLSAAPYLAMWLFSFAFSYACDMLVNKCYTSRGTARKIFNSIGTFFPAIGLILVGFIPKSYASLSVVLLILVGGTTGAGFCGFQVNHMDLSPNHSGILMGLTNGSTSVFSVISPLIVQYIVTDQTNQSMWRIIFIITASVYASTNVIFILFASGEVQPWNESSDNVSESESTQNSGALSENERSDSQAVMVPRERY